MTLPATPPGRTYGAIEPIEGGAGWRITACEPHVAIRLKAVFSGIGKTARPPFVLKGGPQLDADLQWFLARYPMRITTTARQQMAIKRDLFEAQQSEIASILAPDWKPSAAVGFRGNMRPYAYQMQAAELARRTGRLLLADEMGLGKTVSAIASIVAPDHLPALVVQQTHLPEQWAAEIAEFTTLKTHIIKRTKPYELPKADVYLCPYSKIAGWIDYADHAPFKSVILDECQELRAGVTTEKGRAVKAFTARAQMVMGLSGTPIYNYGSEIYQVCNVLEDGALGDWNSFVTEWCTMGPGGKWVVEDPVALGTYLRERHLMLRRTRADVGTERAFPRKSIHTVPYDSDVMAADEAAMRALAQQVTRGSFVQRGQASREFDLRLRQMTGVAKAPHVAAFVKILLAAKQPVVLTGWHRDVYDIWLRELAEHRPVLYTGSETSRQKRAAVEAFTSGDTNLFIMSLRSGAGLNGLQHRCHTIVFGELDWSPQVHAQCTARLDRPYQEQVVDEIYLIADGGADPAMVGVLGLKASQSAAILDPLAAPADQNMDTTRIRQLAELYLAGKSHLAAPPISPRPPASPEPEQRSLL